MTERTLLFMEIVRRDLVVHSHSPVSPEVQQFTQFRAPQPQGSYVTVIIQPYVQFLMMLSWDHKLIIILSWDNRGGFLVITDTFVLLSGHKEINSREDKKLWRRLEIIFLLSQEINICNYVITTWISCDLIVISLWCIFIKHNYQVFSGYLLVDCGVDRSSLVT